MNIAPSAKTEIVVHNDHRIEGLQVKSAPRLDIENSMRGWSKVLLRIARISSVHFALSGTAFDTESGEDIDRLQYSFEGKRAIQVVANDEIGRASCRERGCQ